MINTKNLKQTNKNFLIIQKIFSKYCYQKFYIRKNFLDTPELFYTYVNNKKVTGFSVCKKTYVYSHIHNDKFTFSSFLNKKTTKSKNNLNNFYNVLQNTKKKTFPLFLVKPAKGGFITYYLGILGVLKFSDLKRLFIKKFWLIKKKCSKNFFNLNVIMNFFCLKVSKSSFSFIFEFLFVKRKTFSLKKNNILINRFFFTFVLLLKKPLQKTSQKFNKKFSKPLRQYYFKQSYKKRINTSIKEHARIFYKQRKKNKNFIRNS